MVLNYPAILYIIGWVLGAFGLAMALPALLSLVHGDPDWLAFAASSMLTFFIGVNFVLMNRHRSQALSHRDGFLLTLLLWVILSLLGALPFYFSGVTDSFIDAVFETMSGLTTTGATVLSGLDTLGKGVLFWRAMLQWLGGMGIVVLAIAVLPFLGVGGMQLYKSEMPGVVKDKLQPRLKETAKLLWTVYMFLTLLCALLYNAAGMNGFDAICHAFSTISSGGFSTKDASIHYFDSPLIELICIVFMILGGTNFALHYLFLSRRSLNVYRRDNEFMMYIIILGGGAVILSLILWFAHDYAPAQAVRYGLFNVATILTTTGFAAGDYASWYTLAPIMLLMMMLVGGCSGSTAGGLKVLRVVILGRQGLREIYQLIHPRGISHVKVGNRAVPERVIQSVWSFAGLYIIAFNVIALLVAAFGVDLVTSFSAAAATITSVGPGLGSVGPTGNYASLPAAVKVILTFSMLLGRLEVFTVLVVLSPAFWRR